MIVFMYVYMVNNGYYIEDYWKVIQLVLTLFRNLLTIQYPLPQ